MQAFIINEPYKAAIGEWEKPKLEPNEVLVKVRACGICAGDMYAYTGKNPYAVYPAICGHEIAGVIAEMGGTVEGWEPGQGRWWNHSSAADTAILAGSVNLTAVPTCR